MARVRGLSHLLGVALLFVGTAVAHAQSELGQATSETPWPMNYLGYSGAQARMTSGLLWGLIWLAIAVVVIITLLVIVGIIVRRGKGRTFENAEISRYPKGSSWIYIGVGISTVVLIGYTSWTVATMAEISSPPSPPKLDIEVLAHQWWWQFTYKNAADPSQTFTTANELHIPVGVPVHLAIRSGDVIHSFWVPALAGKTDAIPGRANDTWIEADKPGVYRGQCAEFCGEQHAQMALRLQADSIDDFKAWVKNQLSDAKAPSGDLERIGMQRFELRCGACHAVRGTSAGGIVGPDLTHLMSRTTIAAGMLPNKPADLGGWIANPQTIKPGAKMPNIELSGPELHAIEVYLETLS